MTSYDRRQMIRHDHVIFHLLVLVYELVINVQFQFQVELVRLVVCIVI